MALAMKDLTAMEQAPDASHVAPLVAEVRRVRHARARDIEAILPAGMGELGCGCSFDKVLAQMAKTIGEKGMRRIIADVRRAETRAFNREKKEALDGRESVQAQ
jgi:hypothetical protein